MEMGDMSGDGRTANGVLVSPKRVSCMRRVVGDALVAVPGGADDPSTYDCGDVLGSRGLDGARGVLRARGHPVSNVIVVRRGEYC